MYLRLLLLFFIASFCEQAFWTHTLNRETPYFLEGPQQSRPVDGILPAGTQCVIVSEHGSYTRIASENGVIGYVPADAVQPPNPTKPQLREPQSQDPGDDIGRVGKAPQDPPFPVPGMQAPEPATRAPAVEEEEETDAVMTEEQLMQRLALITESLTGKRNEAKRGKLEKILERAAKVEELTKGDTRRDLISKYRGEKTARSPISEYVRQLRLKKNAEKKGNVNLPSTEEYMSRDPRARVREATDKKRAHPHYRKVNAKRLLRARQQQRAEALLDG